MNEDVWASQLQFPVVHQLHWVVLFLEALPSIITAGDVIFLKSDLSCFGEKKGSDERGTFSGVLGMD